MDLPKVTRVYQNHHLDSTRWSLYSPRPDDIVITTAYKSVDFLEGLERSSGVPSMAIVWYSTNHILVK